MATRNEKAPEMIRIDTWNARPGEQTAYPVLYRKGSWAVIQPGGPGSVYSLTHVPSGMRLCSPKTRRKAELAAREAAERTPAALDGLKPGQYATAVLTREETILCHEIKDDLTRRFCS